MILWYFHQADIHRWRLRRVAYLEPFRTFPESSSRPLAMISTGPVVASREEGSDMHGPRVIADTVNR